MATRGHPAAPPTKSPPDHLLRRSRSGVSRLCHATPTSENPLTSPNTNAITTSTGRRRAASAARSTSATKSRALSEREGPFPPVFQQRAAKENRENRNAIFTKVQKPVAPQLQATDPVCKQRRPTSSGDAGAPPVLASPTATPSAWALSPGRSPASMEAPEAGDTVKKKAGGRGVLGRFFRQKKSPSPKEEEAHELRILFSRLLQWRFVNARAEVAALPSKSVSEEKLFNVWVRVRELRKLVAAKRVLVQRARHQTKLVAVLGPQLRLLHGWDDSAGRKNPDAVARCAGLLRTACTAVPLVKGARADVASLHASISTAMDMMEGIEATIARFYPKVNDMSQFLDELVNILKQEKTGLEELAKVARAVASLELQMQEMSLRAYLVQATKEQEWMLQTHQNKLIYREATMSNLASLPVRASPVHLSGELLH